MKLLSLPTPCFNCPDRKVLCHSKCPKYLAFREEHDSMKTRVYLSRARAANWYNHFFSKNYSKHV